MNVAVKLYSEIDVGSKPVGIPDEWPAEVIEIGESTTLPGEEWVLMTAEDYMTYKYANAAAYIAWSSTYYATTPVATVSAIIEKAMTFGKALTIQFASENVLMGITVSGKTGEVADYLQKLSYYINSGSLYQAIHEVDRMIGEGLDESLAPFVTEARLNAYKARIVAFLG